MPLGTPGLPEPPAFTNARVTADRLLLDVLGLQEHTVELWFSEDLETWTRYDAAAWSRTNGTVTIDLRQPFLVSRARCFFQIRIPVAADHLLVDVVGLEGDTVELWFSEDLDTWTRCDAAAWSRTDGTVTIDLRHPFLLSRARCFFQIRIPE